MKELIIISLLLSSTGTLILGRKMFKVDKKKVGIFTYTREELEQKQILSDITAVKDRNMNVLGVSLNIVAILLNLIATFYSGRL